MGYNLFLDDIRDPTWVYKDPPFRKWIVCQSYQEAIDTVEKYEFPEHVSLDHDLGEDKSGFDFAKYLVNRDLEHHDMPQNFTYNVHSANGPGRDNISSLLNSYDKYRKSNNE